MKNKKLHIVGIKLEHSSFQQYVTKSPKQQLALVKQFAKNNKSELVKAIIY